MHFNAHSQYKTGGVHHHYARVSMDRFSSSRAWPAATKATTEPARKSWFMDESAPAAPAAWRDPRYDIMPRSKPADDYMSKVDERYTFDPNTHPEYRRWHDQTKAAYEFLHEQEAKMAAAADVEYDMEGRAFGVPIAKPGTTLRLYQEYDNDGSYVAPGAAKAFYYAVDTATGRPTAGESDGWAPAGKAAELDDFVRRTTMEWSAPAGLVDPATWKLREGVMHDAATHDAADDFLAAGSARLAAALTRRPQPRPEHAIAGDYVGFNKPPIRLVSRPSGPTVQSVDAMNAAAQAEAAEYAAEQADAGATLEALRARYAATASGSAAAALHARATALRVNGADTAVRASAGPRLLDPGTANVMAQEKEQEKEKETGLTNTPLRAIVPCMMNSARGATYDLAHWSELPTAADGVMPTLQFVATRDGRGPFLLLWVAGFVLVALFIAAIASSSRAKKQSDAVPLWVAALAAGNPQLASAAYQYRT